jgi:hypothetical protein
MFYNDMKNLFYNEFFKLINFMKHRISYSAKDHLYRIETKHFMRKWDIKRKYLYTDDDGNFIQARGFITYENALEWMNDRHPNFNQLHKPNKNENMSFEF